MEKIYFCIDMKSFYASVECVERGLDPMKTNLAVADESRGRGAICLAISPALKAEGVKNRCRLFEIPAYTDCIVAKPQMKKYIEYSADIYEIYLDYISPDDIHVYSIDESFLDVTAYLKVYNKSPIEFATFLVNEIKKRKKIPATAGIGTNLFLAKVALDITAKKSPNGIGYLDEALFKKTLWEHQPLKDFWQISTGTINRLKTARLFTLKDVATADEKILYKLFGVNAEILIDHANGVEPCTIADIKNYKSKKKSVSSSQILFRDYTYEQAETVVKEMVLNGCQDLLRRGVVTNHVGIYIGYSNDSVPATGKTVKMTENTSSYDIIVKYCMDIFKETTKREQLIRRIAIDFSDVLPEKYEQYSFLVDEEKVAKEKSREKAVLKIKDKFGKNALLRGMDLKNEATAIERNKLIGGHNGE